MKVELAKVKKAKELELDEISLMWSVYAKTCQSNNQSQEHIVEASVKA
ncbi:MAG: hypothetical protein ABSB10_04630 [Candidatus Bathyarchaeia archaeon]